MKPSITQLRSKELEQLRKNLRLRPSSLLRPKALVEEVKAHPKKYPNLYSWFDWNTQKAAYQYWLIQARQLLVSVTITPRDNQPVQAYVSLKSDRTKPGGGYRQTAAVLNDDDLREELLQQALDEFLYWQGKYQTLKELGPIFTAGEKVVKRRSKTAA